MLLYKQMAFSYFYYKAFALFKVSSHLYTMSKSASSVSQKAESEESPLGQRFLPLPGNRRDNLEDGMAISDPIF